MATLRTSFTNPAETRRIVQGYVDRERRSGGTRAAVLLDALMAEVDEVSECGDEVAARALLAAADLFLNSADGNRMPDGLPKKWAVSFAIDPLFNRLDAKKVAALLDEAIDGPSPQMTTFFVTLMSSEHGRARPSLSAILAIRRRLIPSACFSLSPSEKVPPSLGGSQSSDTDSPRRLSVDHRLAATQFLVATALPERSRTSTRPNCFLPSVTQVG